MMVELESSMVELDKEPLEELFVVKRLELVFVALEEFKGL